VEGHASLVRPSISVEVGICGTRRQVSLGDVSFG
jgi:hypothetical protein